MTDRTERARVSSVIRWVNIIRTATARSGNWSLWRRNLKGQPLIDGHGNFGNIEGDGAAAMRYTEARLEKLTQDAFLEDLDKDVVDFIELR